MRRMEGAHRLVHVEEVAVLEVDEVGASAAELKKRVASTLLLFESLVRDCVDDATALCKRGRAARGGERAGAYKDCASSEISWTEKESVRGSEVFAIERLFLFR